LRTATASSPLRSLVSSRSQSLSGSGATCCRGRRPRSRHGSCVVTTSFAFWIRGQLQSVTPTKVQAVFERSYDLLRGLVKQNVADDALFIIPLGLTLFLYILVANWLEILPLGFFPVLHGANADWNATLAMGLVVFAVVQWYSLRVLGVAGYLRRFTKPFE